MLTAILKMALVSAFDATIYMWCFVRGIRMVLGQNASARSTRAFGLVAGWASIAVALGGALFFGGLEIHQAVARLEFAPLLGGSLFAALLTLVLALVTLLRRDRLKAWPDQPASARAQGLIPDPGERALATTLILALVPVVLIVVVCAIFKFGVFK